jgi:D-sedoheptulose 7-phosphate isomerase
MKEEKHGTLKKTIDENPSLECCSDDIANAFRSMKNCFESSGKLLLCGNGGSAADCEHIVGELMKGFKLPRKIPKPIENKFIAHHGEEGRKIAGSLQGALPAICLSSHSSLFTAYINDANANMVYAQQVYGYGKSGDILIAISTSGNSQNILNAVRVAKTLGLKTIGMTGKAGGQLKEICDVCICAPSDETYRIQEYHIQIYHAICEMIETEFFAQQP